ncbi:LDCC motif putative metal-binding protein [Lutispora thermophila]|nr:LDCC motif putative metal-binding protein [Lutispora thermophila]
MFKKIKVAIARFLRKLAKSSQEEFGNNRLNCCKLDKPNKDK